MHKRLLAILFGVALICGVAACGSSDSSVATKGRPCTEVRKDLKQAKTTKTKRAGTPAEKAAKEKVADLKKELKSCDDGSKKKDPSTTTTSTSTTTTPASADDVANQIASVFTGFNPGELTIGTKNVKFDGAPEERGAAAFSRHTLKTPGQVGDFLTADSDVSRAAKLRVTDAIRKAGYGDDEVHRAYTGEGYFPIQVNVAAQILGTTYFRDGKVLEDGAWRQVGADDVIWLFMTKDNKIIFGAAVRADCGNPNLTKVQPVRPGTPPATPVEAPPSQCPPSMPHGYWNGHVWVCKDDSSRDPSQQGNAPPQVTGQAPPVTGSASPPAAGTPPTGYNPPEAPTATTVPRGGGGGGTTTTLPPNEGGGTVVVPPDNPGTPPCDPKICG